MEIQLIYTRNHFYHAVYFINCEVCEQQRGQKIENLT